MKCHALVNFMLGNFFPSFLIILDLVWSVEYVEVPIIRGGGGGGVGIVCINDRLN
jgi:hypothetical protein